MLKSGSTCVGRAMADHCWCRHSVDASEYGGHWARDGGSGGVSHGTWPAIPSSVRKVRMRRRMYGGVYIFHRSPIPERTVARAPNREVPPAVASMFISSSRAWTMGIRWMAMRATRVRGRAGSANSAPACPRRLRRTAPSCSRGTALGCRRSQWRRTRGPVHPSPSSARTGCRVRTPASRR